MNTTDFISLAQAICPERDFLVFEGKHWTYSQVSERIDRLAGALLKLGVEKGDRIGVLQVNCPPFIESYFAAAKIGAILVPLNFRAKGDELGYMISNAETRVLFVGGRYWEEVQALRPQLSFEPHCFTMDPDDPGKPCPYEELIQSSPGVEGQREIGDEDVTILMYTSGTTGRPKGVPLRHDAFVTYILQNVEPASLEMEERNLLTVPLYHVAGIQAMLAGAYGGRTLVLLRQFAAKEWLETVQREKVMRAMLVPTMLKRVIDDPDFARYDLTSLRVITYGAAPMPVEVIRKAIQALPGVKFINAFGQTETASTITVLSPEDHVLEGTEEVRQKKLKRLSSSIGKPLPDVEVRIGDEEDQPLPPGRTGEILARGPRIMTEYWRDEEKTAQVITKEGWLRTGDLGWMDEEGYLYLVGRADDMIIRGGENISPEEVEGVLNSHPKVEESAVIGVPDMEWGQQPMAIVALRKGEMASAEEIIEYCRSRLAGFKRPGSVRFLESLPRTAMGKISRKVLREKYGKPSS